MPRDEEGCHLDRMVSEDGWILYEGDGHDFEHRDGRVTKLVKAIVRHGEAHANIAMIAMGDATLANVS